MSSIVAEQGDTIERIHDDVFHAYVPGKPALLLHAVHPTHTLPGHAALPYRQDNVEAAKEQLQELWHSVTRERGMILRVLGILLVVIVLFTVLR